MADEYVQPEFGTGALKVTPAHDPNDFEIARRHGLPGHQRHRRGRAHDRRAPASCYARPHARPSARCGWSRTCGRSGLLRGEEPYTHTVPFSHRSGARVEPLVSLQWFCDMTRLAEPAIAAVEAGRVRFTPPKWGEVYLDLDARDPARGASAASSGGATSSRSGTAATRSTSA